MEMAADSNEYLIGPPPPPPRKKRNRSAGAMRLHSYEPTASNSPMAAGVCSQCVAEAGPPEFEARVFRNPFHGPFPEPLGKENYGSPMQQQASVSPQTIEVLN